MMNCDKHDYGKRPEWKEGEVSASYKVTQNMIAIGRSIFEAIVYVGDQLDNLNHRGIVTHEVGV